MPKSQPTDIDLANVIRALTMDAVENANSGHPGMPMGMAEIAVALWHRHLRHNPANPDWWDRDRFVLSNGHGSMLIYSLLHLTGYDLSIDDLKQFRRLHSKTPGHPEFGITPGVETTTGPLGQGIANAVGMALSEKILAEHFNRDAHRVVDHFTYAFVGDGCLMEGVSHEACSLAGTLGLGKLIVIYDDNDISIDGRVSAWFGDDTPMRFRSYGWQVIEVADGHDVDAVDAALSEAKAETARPSLICCKTIIGKGSPNKADSHASHGSPLGADEVAATRENLNWHHPPFMVPDEIAAAWDARQAGAGAEADWQGRFDAYENAYPVLAAELKRRMTGELPDSFDTLADMAIAKSAAEGKDVASRKASQTAIEVFAPALPELIGGSADLTESNLTSWSDARPLPQKDANYISYGVREFGMAAIMNGMLAHGGIRPFAGTYLTFSDYARNAIRMAALMKLGAIYVLTHDSIALGQDGPTHQPIEHLASLRLMPNVDVWRPCDAVETMVAWKSALQNTSGPTVLSLSRQPLPHQQRTDEQTALIARGGYVLHEPEIAVKAVIIATGSEVALAMAAADELAKSGIGVRVVSMPSTRTFDAQDAAYRQAVLPKGLPRISVEAGVTAFWRAYVGLEGVCIGIDTFGESAAPDVLFEHFGMTQQAVSEAVRGVIA